METDYLGTPVTKAEKYNEAKVDKEYRIICLRVGGDEGDILIEEEDILDGVDAKGKDSFFNESNISGGRFKSTRRQIGLFEEITEEIEKANRDEKCKFETGEKSIEKLKGMPRAQPRQFNLDDNHVNTIGKDIIGDPKLVKKIRSETNIPLILIGSRVNWMTHQLWFK